MRKMMLIMLAVLLTASMANAASNWTRPVASGTGDWGTAANWDTPPASATDYTYMGSAAANADIEVTAAQTYGDRMVLGQETGVPCPLLTIKSGGSLSQDPVVIGDHSYIGRNSGSNGHMIIEAGGSFSTNAKLYVGAYPGSVGTVDVYGTLDLSQERGNLCLGENKSTGQGHVNIYSGGVMKLTTFNDTYLGFQYKDFGPGSTIDIKGTGYIIDSGDSLSYAQEAITYGQIYGDGVVGNVIAYYDPYTDATYMVVNPTPEAQDRYPGEGDSVATANPLTLSWTIPSAYDGNDVYADVWISNDSNALTDPSYFSPVPTSPANGLGVETANIDGSIEGTYYWRVDLKIHTEAGDPNVVGKVMSFNAVSDLAPTVSIETGDTMTWSDESVALAATVTDDGVSTMTYGWTADPDGVSNPDLNIDFSPSANDEDPVVTITNTTGSMVPVTLTLTATDGTGFVDASVTLDVYEDACQMALVGIGEPHMISDLNWDCTTDLLDFAEYAKIWLSENTLPTGPVVK